MDDDKENLTMSRESELVDESDSDDEKPLQEILPRAVLEEKVAKKNQKTKRWVMRYNNSAVENCTGEQQQNIVDLTVKDWSSDEEENCSSEQQELVGSVVKAAGSSRYQDRFPGDTNRNRGIIICGLSRPQKGTVS